MVTLPEEANTESARLLATQDGVQYFAAENDDATAACVAVVPSGEEPEWIAGCSIGNVTGEIVMVTGRNGVLSTKLVTDGFDTQKLESVGWTKIADNLLVHGLQRFTTFEVFS